MLQSRPDRSGAGETPLPTTTRALCWTAFVLDVILVVYMLRMGSTLDASPVFSMITLGGHHRIDAEAAEQRRGGAGRRSGGADEVAPAMRQQLNLVGHGTSQGVACFPSGRARPELSDNLVRQAAAWQSPR